VIIVTNTKYFSLSVYNRYIKIVFITCWTVIIANEDFDQDQSEQSIREEEHHAEEILTICPLHDTNNAVYLALDTNCAKAYRYFRTERYQIICQEVTLQHFQNLG